MTTINQVRQKLEDLITEEPHNEALLRLLDWLLTGVDSEEAE